ncbi:MAG: hypothetical protein OSA92_15695 [Pirellulaceae bacterium]|nr:hypothetical protein [Pirellulaceae bacterium]
MDNICLKPTRVKNFSLEPSAPDQPTKSTQCAPRPAFEAMEILEILNQLVFSDDITVGKLRFAAHTLMNGFPVDSYSNKEIAHIVGKSERTARSIRVWAGGVDAFTQPCEKKIAACSELFYKLTNNIESTNNKHEEVNVLSEDWELVLAHLYSIRFNSFEGEITVPRRSARTIAWVDRWGVNSVLHAAWIAEGPRGATRNKAGFVRKLVESGLKAPEGWSHPELSSCGLEDTTEEINQIDSIPIAPAPLCGPEHELLINALRDNARPQAYRKWLQDLRFADVEGNLICWCPTPPHLAAIKGPYFRILGKVLRGLGLTIAGFQVGEHTHESVTPPEPSQYAPSMPEPEVSSTHERIVDALKREIRPAAYSGWFEILRFTELNDRVICWCPSRSHLSAIIAGRLGTDLRQVLSGLAINEFGFGVGDADD